MMCNLTAALHEAPAGELPNEGLEHQPTWLYVQEAAAATFAMMRVGAARAHGRAMRAEFAAQALLQGEQQEQQDQRHKRGKQQRRKQARAGNQSAARST